VSNNFLALTNRNNANYNNYSGYAARSTGGASAPDMQSIFMMAFMKKMMPDMDLSQFGFPSTKTEATESDDDGVKATKNKYATEGRINDVKSKQTHLTSEEVKKSNEAGQGLDNYTANSFVVDGDYSTVGGSLGTGAKTDKTNVTAYLEKQKLTKTETGGLDLDAITARKDALKTAPADETTVAKTAREKELELLNKISAGKVKTYTQTSADGFKEAKINKTTGEVEQTGNEVKSDDVTALGLTKKTDYAKKQLTTDGVDFSKFEGAVVVDKNGNTTVDLTKITDNDALTKVKAGLNYNGKGKLTVKTGDDATDVKINLGKDANQLDIKGKGKVTIAKADGSELQVDAKDGATIAGLEFAKADNMKHLVINGGKEKVKMDEKALAQISGLKNIEALKMTNANLGENGLKMNLEHSGIIELDKIESKKAIELQSKEKMVANISNTSAEDINIIGEGAELKLSGKTDITGDVNVDAGSDEDNEAIVNIGSNSKAKNLNVKGKGDGKLTIEGKIAESVDASELEGKTGVYLGSTAQIGSDDKEDDADDLKLNSESGNEVVYDANGRKLKNIQIAGEAEERLANAADGSKYNTKYNQQYGGQAGQQSMQGMNGLERFLVGFSGGVNTYNQMNGYNQMNMYNQNPWMQNGQFGYRG